MHTDSTLNWVKRSQAAALDVHDFVDGKKIAPGDGAPLTKWSPRDGSELYSFRSGTEKRAAFAIDAAANAFRDGTWSQATARHRARVLSALADLVEEHAQEFALLESLDVGKPIRDSLSIDVPLAVAVLRANAEHATRLNGQVYSNDATSLSFQLRRPIGVVAALIGWNFPLVLAAQKIGPALAAGNTLILKPSELTSLSAMRLAELALEAGIPSGVLNVVHGDGALGKALADHPGVDLLTFTGSTATGKKLLIASGSSNMKRLILECGGKAANIVFRDCPDLRAVSAAICARAFWNQGQVCTASSRLIVHRDLRDELVALIVEHLHNLQVGDPLDTTTTFGPLISDAHRQKVQAYIEGGLKEGNRILHRMPEKEALSDGFYQMPVIFECVSPEVAIAKEEIFGPILSVLTFETEHQAIELANNSIYGLASIAWTQDLGRAHRLATQLLVGHLTVNASSNPRGGPPPSTLPIGGLKESGFGVEGGFDGLAAYMTQTAVQFFV